MTTIQQETSVWSHTLVFYFNLPASPLFPCKRRTLCHDAAPVRVLVAGDGGRRHGHHRQGTCGMPGAASTIRLLASAITPGRNGLTAYRKLCPSLVATRPAASGVQSRRASLSSIWNATWQWRLALHAAGASASATKTLCRKWNGKIRAQSLVWVGAFHLSHSLFLSPSPSLLPGRALDERPRQRGHLWPCHQGIQWM